MSGEYIHGSMHAKLRDVLAYYMDVHQVDACINEMLDEFEICLKGDSNNTTAPPCTRCTDTDRPLNDDGLCAQCAGEVEQALWDEGPL